MLLLLGGGGAACIEDAFGDDDVTVAAADADTVSDSRLACIPPRQWVGVWTCATTALGVADTTGIVNVRVAVPTVKVSVQPLTDTSSVTVTEDVVESPEADTRRVHVSVTTCIVVVSEVFGDKETTGDVVTEFVNVMLTDAQPSLSVAVDGLLLLWEGVLTVAVTVSEKICPPTS
jgi:hypothetical protein